jgi:hypothetical protein
MEVYTKAGQHLATLVREVWNSEEDMASWFKEKAHTDLDRTTRAKRLVTKVVDEALVHAGFNSGSIIQKDRIETAKAARQGICDFNIYSQIRLNLQEGCPSFNVGKMAEDFKDLQSKYPPEGDSPLAKKAKYRQVSNDEDSAFNAALALVKNLKFASEMQPGMNSYRVTHIGKTPALADLNNLSSMSPIALTPYLTGGELFMFDHATVGAYTGLRMADSLEGGCGFVADGLSYPVHSESGGDILNKSLAARYLVTVLIDEPAIKHIVPRYESLLIMKNGDSEALDLLLQKKLLTPYVKS